MPKSNRSVGLIHHGVQQSHLRSQSVLKPTKGGNEYLTAESPNLHSDSRKNQGGPVGHRPTSNGRMHHNRNVSQALISALTSTSSNKDPALDAQASALQHMASVDQRFSKVSSRSSLQNLPKQNS